MGCVQVCKRMQAAEGTGSYNQAGWQGPQPGRHISQRCTGMKMHGKFDTLA